MTHMSPMRHTNHMSPMRHMTPNDIVSNLICLDDLEKVQIYQEFNTGRQLTVEEILMKFSDAEILDIGENFDARVITDYPTFAIEIAYQRNIVIINENEQDTSLDEFINLQDELEVLEIEQQFVTTNSANTIDDMPDSKKSKK